MSVIYIMIRYLSANAKYWLARIIAVPSFVSRYSSSCITIYKPFKCITTEVSKMVMIYGTFSCMSNRGALFVYSSAFCILFNLCSGPPSTCLSNFCFQRRVFISLGAELSVVMRRRVLSQELHFPIIFWLSNLQVLYCEISVQRRSYFLSKIQNCVIDMTMKSYGSALFISSAKSPTTNCLCAHN